jgi:hypothetical protein
MEMSIAIITAFSSVSWAMDTGRAGEIRNIFNVYLKFPERNPNPFGANLKFDPDANLI